MVAKALGHEHRVELIEQLAQGPRSVEALAERVGLTVANASQHLQQLRHAGLVSTQRDGKRVVYRLNDVMSSRTAAGAVRAALAEVIPRTVEPSSCGSRGCPRLELTRAITLRPCLIKCLPCHTRGRCANEH
jgi:DNA-binding transcriptional ArsR family regulator